MQTLYDLLQVSPDADQAVIAAAFRALSKRYHPDVNKTNDANRVMTEINCAYNTLSDPAARAEYDRLLSTQQILHPTTQPEPFQRSEGITDAAQATQQERESNADAVNEQQEPSGLSTGFRRTIWIIVIIGIVGGILIPLLVSYQPKSKALAPAKKSDLVYPSAPTPAPPANLKSKENLQRISENTYFNSIKKAYPDFESLRDTGKIMVWIQTKPEPERSALMKIYNQETVRDGRFIAYNNGTVLDTKTNLMWARDNGGDINWQGAKSYCDNYRGGGYTDWRMPTQDELAGLSDRGKTCKSACGTDVHLTELMRLSCTLVWASETRFSKAANFDFNYGNRYWFYQSNEYNTRALPVRSGK